ncbi:MAG: hypothetical protein KBF26_10935 [Opitutaceae bacterium]|nr:hypothetical protein [Opitutaceae bacterium]
MKIRLRLPLALLTLLLGGCATTYHVQVSALANPALAASKRTYTFASASENAGRVGDLQFQEVLRHVQRALAPQGFREAAPPAASELNLFVDFGIGDPVNRTYTFSSPIYAELGGGYSTRTRETTDATGKKSTTTETVRIPGRYERVGTDVTTNSVTTYRKHLRLSARLHESGVAPEKGREVWTVTAVCDDQGADLRAALPLLAEAIAPYAGVDTGRAILLTLEQKNGQLVVTGKE